MTRVPLERFLEDLALYGAETAEREARSDLSSVWEALPGSTREAYLDELGIPVTAREDLTPHIEGDEVVFDLATPPQEASDPSLEAAEALTGLDPAALPEGEAATDPMAELEAFEAEAELDDTAPLDADLTVEPEAVEALDEIEALEDLDDLEDLDELESLEELDDAEAAGDEGEEETTPVRAHAPSANRREIEVYAVHEPFAYVRISYDEDHHQYLYEVIEPEMSDREQRVLQFIEETIIDVLDVGLSTLTKEDADGMIRNLTDQVIADYSIDLDERSHAKLTYYTVRDFLGFGKLDVLMRDPMIEDISCDGSGIPIFLYHRKYESMGSTVVFEKDPELDSFVIKLAQRSGKHISVADPLLDARLPDGSRLNATLSREVTAAGSTFTIRKFKPEPFTPPDLIRFGTQSPEMQAYLWMAIQHGASLIYAGGTASGKTTALNAIMLFIPPQMKIVSIEDTRELNLPHPNWIPGTTRAGFGPRDDHGHQAGEIDMFQLLKAALRQRPEFIAVGEVRGEEATVLFQAMATGHAAYGTMHADSVSSVIHRLEGKPISIPRPLLEALDIVAIQIQTRIGGKRVRRTKDLTEIVGLDPNTKELLTNEVFRWDPNTDRFIPSGISYVLERIQRENNLTRRELQEEMARRTKVIEWMVENGVRDYVRVAQTVQAYYNDPETTMARIETDLDEARSRREIEPDDVGPVLEDEADADDLGEIDAFPDLPEVDALEGEELDEADLEEADMDEWDEATIEADHLAAIEPLEDADEEATADPSEEETA